MPELLRYVTAFVALIALMCWTGSAVNRWDAFIAKEKWISFFVACLLATASYGSLEAAHQDAPIGLRVLLLLGSCVGLLAALTWPPTSIFRRLRRR